MERLDVLKVNQEKWKRACQKLCANGFTLSGVPVMHPAARECPHVWCPAVQEEMRTVLERSRQAARNATAPQDVNGGLDSGFPAMQLVVWAMNRVVWSVVQMPVIQVQLHQAFVLVTATTTANG